MSIDSAGFARAARTPPPDAHRSRGPGTGGAGSSAGTRSGGPMKTGAERQDEELLGRIVAKEITRLRGMVPIISDVC